MSKTSFYTGYPLDGQQVVYVEDLLAELAQYQQDLEGLVDTVLGYRNDAQDAAQEATSSSNIATTAADDAVVAKNSAEAAAYDANESMLNAAQSADNAAQSAQTALDAVSDIQDITGDLENAVTEAQQARDEAQAASGVAVEARDDAEGFAQAAAQSAQDAQDAADSVGDPLPRDGSKPMLGDLDMGGFKIVNADMDLDPDEFLKKDGSVPLEGDLDLGGYGFVWEGQEDSTPGNPAQALPLAHFKSYNGTAFPSVVIENMSERNGDFNASIHFKTHDTDGIYIGNLNGSQAFTVGANPNLVTDRLMQINAAGSTPSTTFWTSLKVNQGGLTVYGGSSFYGTETSTFHGPISVRGSAESRINNHLRVGSLRVDTGDGLLCRGPAVFQQDVEVQGTLNANISAGGLSGIIDPENLDGDYVFDSLELRDNLKTPSVNGGPLGGFRNKIINGDFLINDYDPGFTSSLAFGIGYFVNRWFIGGSLAGHEVIQDVSQDPSLPPTGPKNAISVEAGDAQVYFGQKIEGLQHLANQTMTLTFWAKGTNPPEGASFNVGYVAHEDDGGTYNPVVIDTFQVSSGSFQRFQFTFTTPSVSSGNLGPNNHLEIRFWADQAPWDMEVAHVSLVPGDATAEYDPFEFRPVSVEELLCARYYTSLVRHGKFEWVIPSDASPESTRSPTLQFPVRMRTIPALLFRDGFGPNPFSNTVRCIGGPGDGNLYAVEIHSLTDTGLSMRCTLGGSTTPNPGDVVTGVWRLDAEL